MNVKHFSSIEKGCVGLASAISYFTRNKYFVSVPLVDVRPYDLIVEKDGKLSTIQVKMTTKIDKGKYVCSLRNNSEKMNIEFVDYLFIITEDETKYLIPCNQLSCRTNLYLGKKQEKYIV